MNNNGYHNVSLNFPMNLYFKYFGHLCPQSHCKLMWTIAFWPRICFLSTNKFLLLNGFVWPMIVYVSYYYKH